MALPLFLLSRFTSFVDFALTESITEKLFAMNVSTPTIVSRAFILLYSLLILDDDGVYLVHQSGILCCSRQQRNVSYGSADMETGEHYAAVFPGFR